MGNCGNRFRRAFSIKSSDMKNSFAWLIRLLASSSNRYDEDDDDRKENENNLDRDQLNKAKKKKNSERATHFSADFLAAIAQLKRSKVIGTAY